MNQILYKGEIFGGVGEDVTNKEHTITLDEQTLETIGGENSEIFNSYKDKNYLYRNICEGDYSTVIGVNNKVLKYVEENNEWIRPTGFGNDISSHYNFIGGESNLITGTIGDSIVFGGYNKVKIGGYYNAIFGSSHEIDTNSTYGVFVAGQSNKILGPGHDHCSAVFGSSNTLKNNSAGSLLVGGNSNTIQSSYQGIVCGAGNQVNEAQSPAVFGQDNKVGVDVYGNPMGYSISGGGMVSGKSNKVGMIDSGVHVLGTRNNVSYNTGACDNGTLVCGDGNTVSSSHASLISGEGNIVQTYQQAMLGGTRCKIGGFAAVTCGSELISNYVNTSFFTGFNNKAQSIDYSLVSGSSHRTNAIYSSVISGYYLESEDINSSIVVGDSIKIGHRSEKWGVINNLDTYSPDILTEFNTETRDFTDTTSGYIHYLDCSYATNKQGITVIWINSEKYFRKNGTVWEEIAKASTVSYPYLGTTNSYIIDGSTRMSFDIITSAEYETSMYSYQRGEYDRVQVMDPVDYSFDKTYIYLNNEWVEATNSNTPEPYSAYYSIIQGKNIELTSPIRSSAIFGEGHILNAKTDYSLITGYNNQAYGISNIIGRNNTVIYGSDNCYVLGNNNNLTNGARFSRVLGDYNYLDGSASNNTVIGNNTVIKSSANNEFILGDNNCVTDNFSKSLLLGFNNRIGQGNISRYISILGTDNELWQGSGPSNIIGMKNTLQYNGTFCSLIGYGLTNGYQAKGRLAVGRFNECNPAQMANLVIVGNGYTDSGSIVRQNALTIDENGKIITNINNAGYNTFNFTEGRSEFTDNYIGISLDSPLTTENTITVLVGTAEQIAAGEYTTQVWTKDSTFSSVNHTFTDYSSVYFTSEENLSNIYSLPTIGNYYWNPNNWAMGSLHWTKVDSYFEISLGRTTAPTIEAHNIIDYNNNEYYIKGVNESNPYIRTKTTIETVSSVTNGIQTIKFENATITSGYGIGQVDITPNKIIVTSYNNNLDDEKEIVEFTFEDLQSLKNISSAQNINNTPFPQT